MINFFNFDITTVLGFLKDNIKEGEGFIIEKKNGEVVIKDLQGNILNIKKKKAKK